jgi:hypothetical protein
MTNSIKFSVPSYGIFRPRRIKLPGYPERTSVWDCVEAAPTSVFFSYLSLPDKRIKYYSPAGIVLSEPGCPKA